MIFVFELFIDNLKILSLLTVAGGSPAASHFLLLRQKESNQRKGDPNPPSLRDPLRCYASQASS
jgi:hypothetical protein